MPKASFASIVLARFDEPRGVGQIECPESALFMGAAADMRGARSNLRELNAFKFAVYGLHETEGAARHAIDARTKVAPWLTESAEVWSALLRPFRHFGEANFLDPNAPGPVFEVDAPVPAEGSPILIVTSVGWNSAEGEAMERIQRFGEGVAAVRIGMSGLPGLLSQNSFSFPGGLQIDGMTVTLWRNLASAMAFAYGPGQHRMEVKTQRETVYGDRTSFTRFSILHSEGTWHGIDPIR